MPPAIPNESDAESDNQVDDVMSDAVKTTLNESKEDKPSAKAKADDGDQNDEDDQDEGDGQEEDGDEEDTYIVEKIVQHRSDFEDGNLRYWVKWKGYEKKQDRTWEPEENLEGARDILEEYWKSIGGKPTPGQDEPQASSKKRSRSSAVKQDAKDTRPAKKPRGKGGRKSNGPGIEQDVDPSPTFGYTEAEGSGWSPPKATDGSWDNFVQSVDTVVRENSDNELWGFLIWNEKDDDGRFYRSKARLSVIYKACPQRMLKFYEKHLVFSSAGGDDAAT